MRYPRGGIISARCRKRWLVRDYPIRRFTAYTPVRNSEPPEHMNKECNAYNRIMTYRKWVKNGKEAYIKAWWKVRGYLL